MSTSTTAPGIDAGAVTVWCEAELPEVRGPLAFTRVGGGRSNLTFRVDPAAGASFVLRRPPVGPLLAKAHDMEREHRVLVAMSGAGLAVPRPLAVCRDEAVTGAPFYVMENVVGAVPDSIAVVERFSPAARRRMGLSLAETLAELHAIDVDAAGIGELGPRESFVERQIRRMRRQWEASSDSDLPLIEELAGLLEKNAPAQRSVSLVHGDYRLGNVIVGEDGEIAAVLDWELCALGDPLADVGYVLAYWGDSAHSPLVDGTTELEGFVSSEELVARYAEVSGRDVTDVAFFRALAFWKLAVITQGVLVRERRAGANAGREEMPDVPPPLALAEAAHAAGADGGLW